MGLATSSLLCCTLTLGPMLAFQGKPVIKPVIGEVHGFVVNEENEPVKDLSVMLNFNGPAVKSRSPAVLTGPDGKFDFLHVDVGPWIVNTGRPQVLDTGWVTHGYVDTSWDFYQARPNVKITLDAAHPIVKDIKIIVGPKGGTIFGVVTDLATGRPITGEVDFHLSRVRNKHAEVIFDPLGHPNESKGGFRELVPSGVEVALSVESPGYEVWHYADPKTAENNFTLPPESTKLINIGMKPKPQK